MRRLLLILSLALCLGAAEVKDWSAIEVLLKEQKFQEALDAVEPRLAVESKAKNDAEWAKTLILAVQLKTALGGSETAVRFLKDQPWPKSKLPHLTIQLFYARTLTNYVQTYGWEIRQREKVESKDPVDLKAWTVDQINAEALAALYGAWKDRADLSNEPLAALKDYLEPNNYPPGVRSTLRDALSYMLVEQLADTTTWTPTEANERHKLDTKAMLRGPTDGEHPLQRALSALDDLEAWHKGAGHEDAALEARLTRVKLLNAAIPDAEKTKDLVRYLSDYLPGRKSLSWWPMGMYLQATLQRQTGDLVGALKTAREGGGPRNAALAAELEAPYYSVQAMQSDGLKRRSVEVRHKNLKILHFKAYAVDLLQSLESLHEYGVLPDTRKYAQFKQRKPDFTWSVDLPATPDLLEHQTFVTPPFTKPGLYYVVAAESSDFKARRLGIVGVPMVISDFVMMSRTEAGQLHVTVVKGQAGEPVADAKIKLYQFQYGKQAKLKSEATSDKRGEVHFNAMKNDYASYFLVGEKDGQGFIDPDQQYLQPENLEKSRRSSFLYTDRSIYRPNQKLQWKVVAYQGKPGTGNFTVVPNQSVVVTLLDANYQEVTKATVKTNDFGSAAGEFQIPAGRLLGAWHIKSSFGGNGQSVRVEEYKRPTYEVSFKDPTEPLRLNRQAKLKGDARYYFGMPVTAGKVQWRVTRQPVYSWWWHYYFTPDAATQPQTIATGSAKLSDDGSFEVSFLPAAEEKTGKAAQGVTYNYVATADLTDEGGETRTATRSFRLGYVSIDASVSTAAGFASAGGKIKFTAHRASLDGLGRAGTGKYRILELKQPETVLAPADLALPKGDGQRPRHDPLYDVASELFRWADGGEKAHGALQHGEDGDASFETPELPAGAYRVRFETPDDFGATAVASAEFVVAAKDTPLALPAALFAQETTVPVGGKARIFWHSGLAGQTVFFDLVKDGQVKDRRILKPGSGDLIEIPVGEDDQGGFAVTLTLVTDHQLVRLQQSINVPWDNKQLAVEFQTFRDTFKPGSKETWRVKILGKNIGKASAEVLAYMYDKSLDFFVGHDVPSGSSLLPYHGSTPYVRSSLGLASGQTLEGPSDYGEQMPPNYVGDELKFFDDYGIGGMGRRGQFLGSKFRNKRAMNMAVPPPSAAGAKDGSDKEDGLQMEAAAAPMEAAKQDDSSATTQPRFAKKSADGIAGTASAPIQVRSNFAETAFFKPQLITDKDGSVAIEFEAPDSVTAWNFWVVAMTKDLRTVEIRKDAKSLKNLMVRPYMPRFFREGDQADLKVVVNNASDAKLQGELTLEITDPDTQADVGETFGLKDKTQPFSAPPKGSANLTFALKAPSKVGVVAFKVVAKANDESDGELRPLPVLPSRLHLTQSRFVTLKDKDQREMTFPDLAKDDDKSLVTEQMVVSVDAQLFYGVLKALPYLVQYPYECTEQTMNRFVSTGIVSSVYAAYPAVAAMAKKMSSRQTEFEAFDGIDPNRKMSFEESPWLQESRGKAGEADPALLNVLDPRVAKAERDSALAKLRKAQLPGGGFSWFPGGPASPYITLYLMHGLAKATEFDVDVPKDMVERGWNYLSRHYRDEYARRLIKGHVGWEFLTFLNYVASSYPDPSWMGQALSEKERQDILAYSFAHWKEHSPYLKGYLALTLKRMGREKDGKLVFDSVMDSAKTEKDLGTFWAQEDRSWLWYNDTIETHAFALRTLLELDPANSKKDGLVLWLFLNKKLSHWKSTRATAEVIYSLVHYLKKENALGVKEEVKVVVGPKQATFTFDPDKFTGKAQLLIAGPDVDPKTMATVRVEKETKGVAFASATWSFATDEMPKEESGDFFHVTRRFFKRQGKGQEFTLTPLGEGDPVAVGDEVEVQLSLKTKHAAEYVHLRDPRGAGYEPVSQTSGYKWDLGIYWYEEVRDSGANFFFEQLPVGEYTFKYRVRANMAGRFRVGPAVVQSLYAPEFSAYSAGNILEVKGS